MATIQLGVRKTATTALADLVAAPAAGKVRSVTIEVTNVSGALATADLKIIDANTGGNANDGYLRYGYPVPASPDPDSSVTLILKRLLYAGEKIQYRASANGALAFSAFIVEDDA